MPEPNDEETVERDDFALLQLCDLLLFGDHIGYQRLFALRNGVDLQPLNVKKLGGNPFSMNDESLGLFTYLG
jgi:hypothetical protein